LDPEGPEKIYEVLDDARNYGIESSADIEATPETVEWSRGQDIVVGEIDNYSDASYGDNIRLEEGDYPEILMEATREMTDEEFDAFMDSCIFS
jgi:hypothetical protein